MTLLKIACCLLYLVEGVSKDTRYVAIGWLGLGHPSLISSTQHHSACGFFVPDYRVAATGLGQKGLGTNGPTWSNDRHLTHVHWTMTNSLIRLLLGAVTGKAAATTHGCQPPTKLIP